MTASHGVHGRRIGMAKVFWRWGCNFTTAFVVVWYCLSVFVDEDRRRPVDT